VPHEAHAALDELAAALRDGRKRALVVGCADAEGNSAENARVSLARAQRVAAYLMHAGVAADRIEVQASSSNAPIASNESVGGRSLNRRVDVFLIGN
jgi:outer membrane protein OmpA-like peptidoglycan-associated protein